MLKNHFRLAWRNLLKDRQFTLLNGIGLSTGLACAILIWLWTSDERKVDQFYPHKERLYQVLQNIPLGGGGIMTSEHTPDLLANALIREIPEIEDAVIVKSPDEDGNPMGIAYAGGTGIKARELYVTSHFLSIFSCPLVQGNKNRVLADKHQVLLSDQLAMKLFHSIRAAVGKTIVWDRGLAEAGDVNGTYTVAGVFVKPPSTASMQFDLLFAHALYVEKSVQSINWNSSDPATFVLLKKGASEQTVNGKVKDIIKAQFRNDPGIQSWLGTLFLQRYSDKYLHNHYENGAPAGGRIEYVRLFSIIAAFILVVAAINFMNLATAKAARRIKEIGIKKVMGASRGTLILQYLSESMLMAVVSLAAAMMLVWLLLPLFGGITGKTMEPRFDTGFALAVCVITGITGIVAGSYPALYLSGFKPALILKGVFSASSGQPRVRQGLVVFQFIISITLILSVIVVYKQMKLIQTRNLGWHKDNVIYFPNEGRLGQHQQAFLSKARSIPGVLHASDMEGDMFGNHSGGSGIDWPGKTTSIEFGGLYVDHDLMETMGLQMKEGRTFSPQFPSDSAGVIFNETAISAMGLKNPVGQTVKLWGKEKHIIGVVRDFHFESLYRKVSPFFISYEKNRSNIVVKIKAGTEKTTLARLDKLYKEYNPGLPFDYRFLEEDYQALYASEHRVSVLSWWFAGIAILISCLGLFGLMAFTAEKRQKEIGIRKVVGATVASLVTLLSADLLKLALLAMVIAFPLSWWILHHWLENFAYRVSIGPVLFLLTGGSTLVITLGTISFQAIRAAMANPVKSLRSE